MRAGKRVHAQAVALALGFTVVTAALCHGGQVRADVLPPPRPLKCGLGQVLVTDHSGTRCENRRCATDAVCPKGMACVARSETRCGSRRKRCWTDMVSRCVKMDKAKPAPRCPQGAALDKKRTQQALARLRSHEEGKRLMAELGRDLTVCYGEVREGVVQTDGAVVLQRDRPAPANAARLGHLLHHLVRGLPFNEMTVATSTLACDEVAKNANAAERIAHDFEKELRQAFGLSPLPFEDLTADYRKRCQALRKR
jgi:hypothetical protein